jgi:hypothetical protein
VASGAVTTIVMAFAPIARSMGADAAPEETVAPFTVVVAPPALTVGVTVMLVVSAGTLAVYDSVEVENAGDSVPALRVSAESVASDGAPGELSCQKGDAM